MKPELMAPPPNKTEMTILAFLFKHYPKEVKSSVMKVNLGELENFVAELNYLVEKDYAKQIEIPSERKWPGRLQKVSRFIADNPVLTGRSYRITVKGIDLLKVNLETPRKPLTPKQISESLRLPAKMRECKHKHRELVNIQQGSSLSLKGGLPVVSGEKSSFQFVAFYQCKDCDSVFYEEVRKHQSQAN
jgi:hypothetical protein